MAKLILANPGLYKVEAPIQPRGSRSFVSALSFDKKVGWTKEKAVEWSKDHYYHVGQVSTGDGSILVQVKKPTPSKKWVLISSRDGIKAQVSILPPKGETSSQKKVGSVDSSVDAKITGDVISDVRKWHDEGRSPKEINLLLNIYHKGLKLHPSTIFKIRKGTYSAISERPIESEVKMSKGRRGVYENPLIAEILENPAMPIARSQWFAQTIRQGILAGRTKEQIAREMDQALKAVIPPNEYQLRARQLTFKGSKFPRKGKFADWWVTPKSVSTTARRLASAEPGLPVWNLIDVGKLKGRARALSADPEIAGNKQKLHAEMSAIMRGEAGLTKTGLGRSMAEKMATARGRLSEGLGRLKAATSPGEIAPPLTAIRHKAMTKYAKGAARFSELYSPTTGRLKTTRKARKGKKGKKGVGQGVGTALAVASRSRGVSASQINAAIDSAMIDTIDNLVDTGELATIDEILENPGFAGIIPGGFGKLTSQLLGTLIGAWGVKGLDLGLGLLLNPLMAKMNPGISGFIKNLVSSGATYALLPLVGGQIKLPVDAVDSAQTIAIYKFLNGISIAGFKIAPDVGLRPKALAAPKVGEIGADEYEVIADNIEAVVDEDTGEPIELTEEEVGQLLYQPKWSGEGELIVAQDDDEEETGAQYEETGQEDDAEPVFATAQDDNEEEA